VKKIPHAGVSVDAVRGCLVVVRLPTQDRKRAIDLLRQEQAREPMR
jgi:hypothetical protein